MTEQPSREANVLTIGVETDVARNIAWRDVSKSTFSLTDFDVVIVNLVELGQWRLEERTPVAGQFLLDVSQFIRQAFGRGDRRGFVLIGDPSTTLTRNTHSTVRKTLLPWLPNVHKEHAQVVEVLDTPFAGYMRLVGSVDHTWERDPNPIGSDFNARVCSLLGASSFTPGAVSSLALGRSGDTIGVSTTVDVQIGLARHSQTCAWLPTSTKAPLSEAVRLLLADCWGVNQSVPEPSWAVEIVTPAEAEARGELAPAEAEASAAAARAQQIRDQVVAEHRFVGCLYEQGDPLHDLVDDMLAELGATIRGRTEVLNRQDTVLATPGGVVCVAEVKGVKKSFTTEHARQLDDWRNEVWVADGCPEPLHKAVAIVNTWRNDPPSQRSESWPPDVLRFAGAKDMALLTTDQLLAALILAQRSEADGVQWDAAAWWEIVEKASGPSRVPTLTDVGVLSP